MLRLLMLRRRSRTSLRPRRCLLLRRAPRALLRPPPLLPLLRLALRPMLL